jgi:hypothetical protein
MAAHIVTIKAPNTPNDTDPANASEFYAALGMLSVAWGRLEGHVIGNLLPITALLEDAEFPLKWNNRLKLWKRAFSSVPALQQYQDRAISLMKSIIEEAENRNFAAHAVWEDFERDAAEPTMTARAIRPKGGRTSG